METIETLNDTGVTLHGDKILVLLLRREMDKAQALRHAAWIVALADDGHRFAAILEAVRNT